jgi:hypothetical protein
VIFRAPARTPPQCETVKARYGKPFVKVLKAGSFSGRKRLCRNAASRVRYSCNSYREAAVDRPEIMAMAALFRLIAA